MRRLLLSSLVLAIAVAPAAQVNVTVATDRTTYTTADTVLVSITATNTSGGAVTLRFGTGRQADFEVNGAAGPFYCAFTLEPTEVTLGPGESYTWGGPGRDRPPVGLGCYDYVLNDDDQQGVPTPNLGPGTYPVVGYVGFAAGPYVRYGAAKTTFTVTAPSSSETDVLPAGYSVGAVYPNPAQAWTSLPLRVPTSQDARVHVLDALGREVYATRTPVTAGENRLGLDLGGLPSGVYSVRVEVGPVSRVVRVAVVR